MKAAAPRSRPGTTWRPPGPRHGYRAPARPAQRARRFLAEVARDWGRLFPRLPCQSKASRRTRWLRGAFEQLRTALAGRLPEDGCQQADTSALPVKHPSRFGMDDCASQLRLPQKQWKGLSRHLGGSSTPIGNEVGCIVIIVRAVLTLTAIPWLLVTFL